MVSTDALPSLRETFPCLQAPPPQTLWTPLADNKRGVDVRQGGIHISPRYYEDHRAGITSILSTRD